MTQPEDRQGDNTVNLGKDAEENLEETGIETTESAENNPDQQTENVKNVSEENTRKRKLNIGEGESEGRESKRGPLTVQRSFSPRGIENTSDACFINVALQCLLAMDNIRERYVKPLNQVSQSNYITYNICNLLAQRCSSHAFQLTELDPAFQLTELDSPSEGPIELQNKLYRGREKKHSGQTILEIVSGLDGENQELKLQEGSEIRPLMDDFMIRFQTKVKCSNCEFEIFLPVKSLPRINFETKVIPDMNLLQTDVSREPQLMGKWSLEALLPLIELQDMKDKIALPCDRCKRPWIDKASMDKGEVPAMDKAAPPAKFEISITKAPRILVVSWMAKVIENTREIISVCNYVDFETYLDLSKFVSMSPSMRAEDYKYRLIAVADFQSPDEINAKEPIVGHTRAFILGSKYGHDNWIEFNDRNVRLDIEESHVLNVTHWVSVYEKENVENDPINFKRRVDMEIDLNKLPTDEESSCGLKDGESSGSMSKSKDE